VSATVLADGRVVATGGSGVDNTLTDVNTSAEIWNPADGSWTVGPSGSRARMYHSGALLLPSGAVLITVAERPGRCRTFTPRFTILRISIADRCFCGQANAQSSAFP
jgi:hypothetical protein